MTYPFNEKNLVFIAGCPRSGTTYLQRLLAAMPGVHTSQESHLFYLVEPLWRRWRAQVKYAKTSRRGPIGLPCFFSESEFWDLFRNFLYQAMKPMVGHLRDDEFFVEKTPSNALYIDIIHELLPEARVISIQRDARDVVASLLAASRSWGSDWAPGTPSGAAHLWRDHTLHARRAGQRMPAALHYEIKYENLVSEPVKFLGEITSFIGLPATASDIETAVAENSLKKMRRSGGTRIPLQGTAGKTEQFVREPEGFIRKGKPNGWKNDLSLYEKLCVWFIARSTMRQVGYDWRCPW